MTRYVRRFSRTERALHWANALGFFVLLVSGLMLYLPSLEMAVGRRPLIKDIHFWSGIGWVALLAAVFLLGDRRVLLRTAREIEMFDADDRAWLERKRSREGRFNAGQKINAIADGCVLRPVRRLGAAALARRARHGVPLREHRRPARRAHVRLAHPADRSPLPRADSSGHAALAARDDASEASNEDWARWHHPRWVDPK